MKNTENSNWVLKLLIINIAIYFLQTMIPSITYYFALTPDMVIGKLYLWQIVTYMFLHGGFLHIFLNMYALLLFGAPVEDMWGSKTFLKFYFFTGIGAGFSILVLNYFMQGIGYYIPTLGASGAIFGLLLAFGLLFPNTELLIFFVLPMKAKYLVVLYGLFEFYSLVSSAGQGNISHIGHLGGLLFGLIYFFILKRKRGEFRIKKFKTKINNIEKKRDNNNLQFLEQDNKTLLLNLLQKIKFSGFHSLSDDEIQFINYMKIMGEELDLVNKIDKYRGI